MECYFCSWNIIVSWEAGAQHSISTVSGGEICLKDIVSNTSLDLIEFNNNSYSAIGLVFNLFRQNNYM